MAKHMVICRDCGKQFDASKGGYYLKSSGRYLCPKCGRANNKEAKEAQANERERKTGMRQSQGAMIAKIVIGVLFIVSAFTTGSVGATLVGIVIGLGLIAWGFLPWYLAKKAAAAEVARLAAEKAAEEEKRLNAPKICPTCGAKTKGEVCEYCGAPLE